MGVANTWYLLLEGGQKDERIDEQKDGMSNTMSPLFSSNGGGGGQKQVFTVSGVECLSHISLGVFLVPEITNHLNVCCEYHLNMLFSILTTDRLNDVL